MKILDLGWRGRTWPLPGEEMTATGQALGTIDYMAPEQIAEKAAVDVRADIYSLGCTLYKLLTGNAPFSGPGCQTVFEKMQAHLKKPPPQIGSVRRDVPPELAAIINRMLAKNPEGRFAAQGQVADAIGPLAGGSNLVRLLSKALAKPVVARTQEQVRTDESMPSSMTRMFQQFKLARRERQAKPAAAGNPWRRWAPLLGCSLLAAVFLPLLAVMMWSGGQSEPSKVAQAPASEKSLATGRENEGRWPQAGPDCRVNGTKRREEEKPAPPPEPEKPRPQPVEPPVVKKDETPPPVEPAENREERDHASR